MPKFTEMENKPDWLVSRELAWAGQLPLFLSDDAREVLSFALMSPSHHWLHKKSEGLKPGEFSDTVAHDYGVLDASGQFISTEWRERWTAARKELHNYGMVAETGWFSWKVTEEGQIYALLNDIQPWGGTE